MGSGGEDEDGECNGADGEEDNNNNNEVSKLNVK